MVIRRSWCLRMGGVCPFCAGRLVADRDTLGDTAAGLGACMPSFSNTRHPGPLLAQAPTKALNGRSSSPASRAYTQPLLTAAELKYNHPPAHAAPGLTCGRHAASECGTWSRLEFSSSAQATSAIPVAQAATTPCENCWPHYLSSRIDLKQLPCPGAKEWRRRL